MINLFKRKEVVVENTQPIIEKEVAIKNKVITSKDIQQDMENKLKFILGKNNVDYVSTTEESIEKFKLDNKTTLDKAEKLRSLGFINTPAISKGKEIVDTANEKMAVIETSKEEMELTNKYRLEYPMYKFIPERIYNEVMEKYDLYKSEPKRYIKEIPTKNLEEIINFKSKIKPLYELVYNYSRFIGSGWSTVIATSNDETELIKMMDNKYNSRNFEFSYEVTEKNTLEITAPIDHFNLEKSEISSRSIKDIVVEDPIVTHQVKGGYIIVSVWDKEAEIPEIINGNFN